MMRLKLLILITTVINGITVQAQDISLVLGYYPEQPYVVTIKQGTATDTIHKGILDKEGKGIFSTPKGYAGMATLSVGVSNFDFILSDENFTLSCPQEYIYGGNVEFSGSQENDSLQLWFYQQAVREQKIALLAETEKVYDPTDLFLSLLTKEKEKLLREQSGFEGALQTSPLYASRFIKLYNFQNKEVQGILFADSLQKEKIRTFVRDSLDVNLLFNSGLWFSTLNGLLALYDYDTVFHRDFIDDMSKLLERTASDRIYTTLAENLFAICETTGWNNLEEELAYFLLNDARIKEPTGRFKVLMNLLKLFKGNKAPVLANGHELRNTLLVFHESGCGSCENEMEQLKNNYSYIQSKGYEIVSISTDRDDTIFRNTTSSFPWKHKYCDLKGFESPDFMAYGVIGTPTFYLINEDGIVTGRYARLQDTDLFKNEEK
ncbi:MAG: thioredoxin family protein [Bacteroidales bacterium]|nr:thioredoxin family protein [Bacteroidales bacterium]